MCSVHVIREESGSRASFQLNRNLEWLQPDADAVFFWSTKRLSYRLVVLTIAQGGSRWPPYAGLLSSTLTYVEKVRAQFLSLRHIGLRPVFSTRSDRQLSPVSAAISNLSHERFRPNVE
jgi:hypothetical protein